MLPADTNTTLERLRDLIPTPRRALAFAQALPRPLDPIINRYLNDHLGAWALVHGGQTEQGPVRMVNEDALFINPIDRVYAVFDGMGGNIGGLLANRIILESMALYFPSDPDAALPEPGDEPPLLCAAHHANARLRQMALINPLYHGCGSTFVGAVFTANRVLIAHAGDCRAYRLRSGQLDLLTEDHSLARERALAELPDWEHIDLRRIVTRAIGVGDELQIDTQHLSTRPGDRYLLCTDGLHFSLEDEKIHAIIAQEPHPDLAAQQLILSAIEAGGEDNLTALLVGLPPAPG